MRNLFLALVLANLAFAAWSNWFAPEPPGREPEPSAPPIRLVSEAEPGAAEASGDAADAAGRDGPAAEGSREAAGAGPRGEAPRIDVAPRIAAPSLEAGGLARPSEAPPGADAARERCISVGPFAEASDAEETSARLRSAGYDVEQRVGEGDIWVGYWVHLDAIDTREAANRMLETLHENGVTEAYLIPGEDEGDIISLGVFNEIERAGRLRDEVMALGFDPLIVDRARRGTVHWLDVALDTGEEIDFETLQPPGRIVRLERRPCEAPAA